MDIDHFKKINDTYGHMAGDEILRKLGSLLKACKRDGEILARFGGEEFVMCLFNTDSESAILAAERFRLLVSEHDFSNVAQGLKITLSIGVAVWPQENVTSIDELVKAADKALYKSKSLGRDRVTLFEWTANNKSA
jgi:two-component system cell cycle response regulator